MFILEALSVFTITGGLSLPSRPGGFLCRKRDIYVGTTGEIGGGFPEKEGPGFVASPDPSKGLAGTFPV